MDDTATKRFASRFNALAHARGVSRLQATPVAGVLRLTWQDKYIAHVPGEAALTVLQRFPQSGMGIISVTLAEQIVRAVFGAYGQGRAEGGLDHAA